jgi:hypothetical protein
MYYKNGLRRFIMRMDYGMERRRGDIIIEILLYMEKIII